MAQILTLVLVITQVIILLFIGGFARTQIQLSASYTYITQCVLFLLSWTLMNAPFKKLTLHTLTLLILIIAVTFQSNLLFGRFWYSIFNTFQTSYQITNQLLAQCIMSIFTVLLITIDYIGIFRYWQAFVILIPIVNFGWAFNYCVLRYGLVIFDGAGGLTVFLFAGVVSLVVWVVCVRGSVNRFGAGRIGVGGEEQGDNIKIGLYKRQQYYNGYTISLYGGLIGTFLLWPTYTAYTSLQTSTLPILTPTLKNSIIFPNSAYTNTILALSMGTCLSFMLITRDNTKEEKLRIRCVIDCFINAGIVCASFVDLVYNPAAVMVMALVSSIVTLVVYWYHRSNEHRTSPATPLTNFLILLFYFSRALFRIVFPLLGIIVTAIAVSTRSTADILLLDTATYGSSIYSKTAGLEIVGYVVTVAIAGVCGGLGGVGVNFYMRFKEAESLKQMEQAMVSKQNQNQPNKQIIKYSTPKKLQSHLIPTPKNPQLTDFTFLQLDYYSQSEVNSQQIFPLFLEPQDAYIDQQQTARRMLKQAILSHVKTNYINVNNYISVNNVKSGGNVRTNSTNVMEVEVKGRDHGDGGGGGDGGSRFEPTSRKFDSTVQKDFHPRPKPPTHQSIVYQNKLSDTSSAILKDQRDLLKQTKRKQQIQQMRERELKRLQEIEQVRQRQIESQKRKLREVYQVGRVSPESSGVEEYDGFGKREEAGLGSKMGNRFKGKQEGIMNSSKEQPIVESKRRSYIYSKYQQKVQVVDPIQNTTHQHKKQIILQIQPQPNQPPTQQPLAPSPKLSKSQTQIIMPITHLNNLDKSYTPRNTTNLQNTTNLNKKSSMEQFQLGSLHQNNNHDEGNVGGERISRKLTYDRGGAGGNGGRVGGIGNSGTGGSGIPRGEGQAERGNLDEDPSFILEENQHQEDNSQEI